MDFILNQQAQFVTNMQKLEGQQAQFAANMQKLEAADERANKRIDRLERVLKLVISAGLRERKERRESIKALIASQTHTDQRLDVLIDIVNEGRNGKS
jgi:hypothetical protein